MFEKGPQFRSQISNRYYEKFSTHEPIMNQVLPFRPSKTRMKELTHFIVAPREVGVHARICSVKHSNWQLFLLSDRLLKAVFHRNALLADDITDS